MKNINILKESKLALSVLRNVFTSEEIGDETVIIFAGIVKNQSIKLGIDWTKLLRQYKELSSEIYTIQTFKNNKIDFFKQTQRHIESDGNIL